MADPFSASIAISIAANLLIGLLTSTGGQTQEVGKLDNKSKAPSAQYGGELIQPYGRCRINACSLFWAVNLKERSVTRGGKGFGGGGNAQRRYTYYMKAAYHICAEIQSVRRVWLNSELVYASDYNNPRSAKFMEHWQIYTGDDQQEPSSIIEAVEGIGNVPNFRGMSYAVCDWYPLIEFDGNGFPKMDVEVIGKFGENPKVKDIIVDVCKKAGLLESQIDVSDLDDSTIPGFTLKYNGTPFHEQLKQLLQLYFIIAVETRDGVVFKHQPRNSINAFALPKSALAVRKFGEDTVNLYEKKSMHPRELATGVSVEFTSIDKDYETIPITARDPVSEHRNETSLNITNCITTDGPASTLATRALYLAREQSTTITGIKLLPSWNSLQVGQLIGIDFTRNFQRECYQITKKIRSPDYIVEIEAVKYQGYMNECLYRAVLNLYIYQSSSTNSVINVTNSSITFRQSPMRIETTLPLGQASNENDTYLYVYDGNDNIVGTISTAYGLSPDSNWTIQEDCTGVNIVVGGDLPTVINDNQYISNETPRTYGTAEVIPFETALLDPDHDDTGIYIAIKGDEDFRFGLLYESEDNTNWTAIADILTTNTVGETTVVPSTFNQMPAEFIDESSRVRVRIDSGEIDPVILDDFIAGKFPILIGNEILLYKNAEIVTSSPLVYELSYFLRGLRGTEKQMTNHIQGERVILLDENIIRIPKPLTAINKTYYYKAVPYLVDEPSVLDSTAHTVIHESIRPFTCIPVQAVRLENNDVMITWSRRTRINGELIDYIDIPFAPGELNEFTLTISVSSQFSGTVKTFTVTGTQFLYPSASQIQDFGNLQQTYTVEVFQHSSYPVAPAPRDSFAFSLPIYP